MNNEMNKFAILIGNRRPMALLLLIDREKDCFFPPNRNIARESATKRRCETTYKVFYCVRSEFSPFVQEGRRPEMTIMTGRYIDGVLNHASSFIEILGLSLKLHAEVCISIP